MKRKHKLLQKELFLWKLDEIVTLYSLSSLSVLFYDLAAINSKSNIKQLKNSIRNENVKDLNSQSKRPEKLEKLISELFDIAKNQPIGLILKE